MVRFPGSRSAQVDMPIQNLKFQDRPYTEPAGAADGPNERPESKYSSGGDFKNLADANAKVKDAVIASRIQNCEEESYD